MSFNRLLFFIGALFFALLAMQRHAEAADAEGKYAVRGVGSSQCKQLTSAIDSQDQKMRTDAVLLYSSWLNGYLSYVNRTEKGTYDVIPLTDGSHLLAVVVNQCRQEPEALVETVSAQVIGLLARAKVESESPQLTVKVGEQQGSFRKATIVDMQEKLKTLGYLKGPADGDFGKGSQNALARFQKAEELEITGFPDTDTVIRLLLKPAKQ